MPAGHSHADVIRESRIASARRSLGRHFCDLLLRNLIAEVISVIEFGGSSEDIDRTCHSHPTLSEAVKEAALSVE